MSQTRAILVASQQAVEVQAIIQTNMLEQGLVIDVLDSNGQLFEQLPQYPRALLIIDLALVPAIASFFMQIEIKAPHTSVLLLAAEDERGQAIEYLQQGAADYLLRPIEPAELIFKINRILEFQALKQKFSTLSYPEAGVDELLMLSEASQEIIQTLQLDEALNIVLSRACQMTEADLARIYLADQKGDLSKSNFFSKTSLLANQLSQENLLFTLAQQAAFTQEIITQDKTTDRLGQNQPIVATLFVPLVSREKLSGVLALGSTQVDSFSANHIRWLSVFCNQAAVAIENARLFQGLSSAYIDLARSREKMLHGQNTLRVVFDGITDGLCILDQDLTINALNRVEAERQGGEPDALIGKSYLSLKWAQATPELLNQIRESLRTGKKTTWISSENEIEPNLKDREFRIYPIHDRLGQIEQVLVFAQDVSERRRWQASLFRSANLAAVGQLAGSVAHQINNPLTVTMTNSQLLLIETEPDNEAHDLAAGILKAGERIQNIVTNLLEFSNQEQYFFVQTSLIDTIEGALALVIRSLKKANIQIVKDYEAQPMLSASVSHLKLVWVNLLLNARDAIVGFTDQPLITISTKTISQREVKVTIKDNGVGLTEGDFEQLFRPFFTTKPAGKALGLGLYSTQAIIERHRGQIRAFYQPGDETTFEVILPLDNPRDL